MVPGDEKTVPRTGNLQTKKKDVPVNMDNVHADLFLTFARKTQNAR